MAIGDDALAGKPEYFHGHRFAPDPEKDREISWRGRYLEIVNQKTMVKKVHIDNVEPTTTFEKYEVPKDYTCYVRGADAYFED